MEIKVNDKIYNIKQYGCDDHTFFPLYVNVTNKCNAKCKFCANECHKNYQEFDSNELENILKQIYTKISRVSLSGGEPLLDLDNLEKALKIIPQFGPRITLNTNGTYLEKALPMLNKYPIENIILSRHHYLDKVNNEIFGTNVLALEELSKLNSKAEVRINCLLIKDYIDSSEEIIKFIESLKDTNINNIGFISLMPANEYAKNHFIDYRDITNTFGNEFIKTISREDGIRCSCCNYIYRNSYGNEIYVYFRYTADMKDGYRSLYFDPAGLSEGY